MPRRVVPGKTLFISRRCSERRFFLRPCKATRSTVLYLVAEAANRFGVKVHALCVMSNHLHMVITDTEGRYPEFLCQVHKLIAKTLNAHWGRWENLWASEQTSVVELTDEASVLDKIAYTLANPAEAHLVASIDEWPGASSWGALDGRVMELRRPGWFFDEKGPMPERVTMRYEVPPAFAGMSREGWAKLVRTEVRKRERAAARERKELGLEVLGRRKVMRQSAFEAPKTSAPRRGLKPRVAGRNKWRRIEALQRNKAWLEAYRSAFVRLRDGFRDAVFPAGTYELARLGLVTCHEL